MSRTLSVLVVLLLGATSIGCGARDRARSSRYPVTAATTAGTSGAFAGAHHLSAPDLGTAALSGLTLPAGLDPDDPGASTAPAGGGAVGSRFWYVNDAFGNPLQGHSSAEASLAAEVLAAMNAERAKAGLPPLAASTDGERAAKAHAEDMRDRSFFDHISPEGWTPDDRLRMTGAASYSAGGENIAAGLPQARAIVDVWMSSPVHRANILSNVFTEVGVGVAEGAPTYVCAVFIGR